MKISGHLDNSELSIKDDTPLQPPCYDFRPKTKGLSDLNLESFPE